MTINALLPSSDSPLGRDILERYDFGQGGRTSGATVHIETVDKFPDELASKTMDGVPEPGARQFALWAGARLPLEHELKVAGRKLDLDEVVLCTVPRAGVGTVDFPALKQGTTPEARSSFVGVSIHLVAK